MLNKDGEEVKLCDFGCSEFFKEVPTDESNLSKTTKGTYLFMAPEMFKQDVARKGDAIDIWASGVTLFNLLTKKYPFQVHGNNPMELADKIKN